METLRKVAGWFKGKKEELPSAAPLMNENEINALAINMMQRDKLVRGLMTTAMGVAARVKADKEDIWERLLGYIAAEYSRDPKHFDQTMIKNNIELRTVDGLNRIKIRIAKLRSVDATTLAGVKPDIMACLNEWSEGAYNVDAIRGLVMRAFEPDASGNVNRWRVLLLLQVESDDPRWVSAMAKLKASSVVTDMKHYINFFYRKSPKDKWTYLTLNFSSL
jgi:hypothetical protein